MDLGLIGKVALVCAASKGIGRAIAQRFSEEGAKVAICARHEEDLKKTANDISTETGNQVKYYVADVCNKDDVTNLIKNVAEDFGAIDIIIPNSGGPRPTTFQDATDEDWNTALNMNLLSTIHLCREALPHLKKSDCSSIVNVVSLTVKDPVPNLILSTTARLGVLGMAKYLASEIATDGVRVNSILPGYTLTDRVNNLVKQRAEKQGKTEEAVILEMSEQIPMKRMGDPLEIADAAVFLASKRASYITGTYLLIDGGLTRTPI